MANPPLWTETPLLFSSKISETLGVSAYLKLENLHPSHSFKYRGLSLFAQRALETHGHAVHLIVASGGNAGLAVACAANALNVKSSVYLPSGAAQSTLDILRRQGAEVIVTGRFYAEALQAAQAHVNREHHAVLAPAYDHEVLWEGHGSMVSEISSQLSSKPDAIFCSVGGGGLLGGLIHGCRQIGWDDVPLITLETIGSDCFFHSISLNSGRFNSVKKLLPPDVNVVEDLEHGVTLAHFNKFSSRASGSLGASQPSPRVVKMALSRSGNVVCASVPDELSMQALGLFTDDHKLLVELACSTTLTPAYKPAFFDRLMPVKASGEKRTVVFIVCGGFKISLDDATEYRRLADEDKARGGTWSVLINDGSTFGVDK
ncbi:L-serine dehydratase [Termitomyces sp. T112]|nr:L-serine dehydratase [Termitomyces sp. T112]